METETNDHPPIKGGPPTLSDLIERRQNLKQLTEAAVADLLNELKGIQPAADKRKAEIRTQLKDLGYTRIRVTRKKTAQTSIVDRDGLIEGAEPKRKKGAKAS